MKRPSKELIESSLRRLGQSRVDGDKEEWDQFVRSTTELGFNVRVDTNGKEKVVVIKKVSII